jgi:hypothetical protein
VVSRRERFNAPDERCRAQPNSVSRIVFILFKSLANCVLVQERFASHHRRP